MATITVNKTKIDKEKGVVILSLKEYDRLVKNNVPTYYLTGKAAKDLDKLVEEGLKEYREGKTVSYKSFLKKEYPRLYKKHGK
ncbi:MAG: hypothetical protein Q7R86_01390 [bacterium]|nr:hypothetical protein [bacterium]